MSPASPSPCPDENEIRALLRGDVAHERGRALAEHVIDCARCAERADRIAGVLARRGTRSGRAYAPSERARWPMWAGLCAGVIVGVFMLVHGDREPRVIEAPAATPPNVRAFARTAGHIEELGSPARLAAGDRVRFTLGEEKRGFVLVLSVTASGKVRIVYPPGGAQARAWEPSDRGFLPESWIVPSDPPPHRVFLLFGSSPVRAKSVARLVRRGLSGAGGLRGLVRLPLPAVRQWSLLVEASAGE